MKKIIGIIICAILVFATVGCNSNNPKKIVYEGIGNEWQATVEFNTGEICKTVIKYMGNDKKPLKLKFATESLSGNISGGEGEYSENLDKAGGLTIQTYNDDTINGNIKKYKNSLKIEIEWNSKKEQINLTKKAAS